MVENAIATLLPPKKNLVLHNHEVLYNEYMNVNADLNVRKLGYCSPGVKCCMFKSYCSTMYCSSMWFDSTVTSMRKLKNPYNNGLRRIYIKPDQI